MEVAGHLSLLCSVHPWHLLFQAQVFRFNDESVGTDLVLSLPSHEWVGSSDNTSGRRSFHVFAIGANYVTRYLYDHYSPVICGSTGRDLASGMLG